eukprot:12400920-Karenia_brevis.AAC.1
MDDKIKTGDPRAWSKWFLHSVVHSVERQRVRKRVVDYTWTESRVANDAEVGTPDVSRQPWLDKMREKAVT